MNKKLSFLFLIPALLLSACAENFDYEVKPVEPETHYDNVYIIMGQSNATGVAPVSFLETKSPTTYLKYSTNFDKVEISYDVDQRIESNFVPVRLGFGANEEYFGPEIGISEVISEVDEKSYIIKATWSGSCLQSQYVDKNGNTYELYDRFVPFIKDQLKKLKKNGKNPRVKGLFWMQGEADSFDGLCDTYGEATQWFVKRMRKNLNDYVYGYMNFVDAEISTKSIHWPHADQVNLYKDEFAALDEHNYCIHTNGEDDNAIDLVLKVDSGEGNDAAHYDSLSMLALGKEAGKYLIK